MSRSLSSWATRCSARVTRSPSALPNTQSASAAARGTSPPHPTACSTTGGSDVTESLGIDDLWGLIEARADATPDGLLAVDELDRVVTFGEYRDQCVAQADALRELGID